ncbi:hypothetical protein N7491_004207 [Penicillium cf. griseofulvum]|uniref:Uncharacterized protein n=1 Tax=Penicillium cf. griseofulvum TaxID=2972120 RepID=A0A9W9MPK8_9EURO|nr:hypothetical protein N7472_001617 [Penicillium cf. griseofulvum]KAJ5437673.1 hypothetical protein N7445_006217 [Penicillium cf. griseofulvum]KAJ5441801.1 hypothetical protein N7491_004207 [Penicillium cf. griseofulvum]
MNTILGLVPSLLNLDFSFGWKFSYAPIMQSPNPSSATMSAKESTSISPYCAPPPSYNDVSGPVIIAQDGSPQYLSPEEEVERQHRLQQAVREKMLGLPRTTKFEWHRGTSGTSTSTSEPSAVAGTVEELQLPPYTPRDEK